MTMLKAKAEDATIEKVLSAFSEGRISRQRALHLLDVDYSKLLDMMAEHALSIPELSDEEAAAEARKMASFLDAMGV
jgi:hypothetical protein